MNMNRNKSIDLLKLVSILFVAVIHNPFSGTFGFIMDAAARFAVPVFFMATGYFVSQSTDPERMIRRQVVKLARYYVLYELLYFVYFFFQAWVYGDLTGYVNDLFSTLKLFLIGPVLGNHLWYVINAIWALLILWAFYRMKKTDLLIWLSLGLYVCGLLIAHLSFVWFHRPLELYQTRNFLFFGLFFLMLGLWTGRAGIKDIRINKYALLIISILLCLLQPAEKYLWNRLFGSTFGDYFITTVFASMGLFVFALKCDLKNQFVSRLLPYSMPIYFLHMMMMNMLSLVLYTFFKLDWAAVHGPIAGNLAFILTVCVLSALLYVGVTKAWSLMRRSQTPLNGSITPPAD